MTSERTILAQLAELDPTRHEPLADPGQVDATLAWVLAHERVEPVVEIARPRRRRMAVVGAAAALVLGIAAATVLPAAISGNPSLAAATTPMLVYADPEGSDATAELEALADRVGALPDPAPPAGSYRHLREESETWDFPKIVGKPMTPKRLTYGTEKWIAEDGTSRWLQTRNGRLDGGYVDYPAGFPPSPSLDVSGTPEEVVRRISRGVPADQASTMLLHYFGSTVSYHGQLPAAQRAAYLDALATTDVISYGAVTDRAGRAGIAFGATDHYDPRPAEAQLGPPTEESGPPAGGDGYTDDFRIILDPRTGELLGTESISSAGPDLPLQTVTAHTTFFEDTYVAAPPDCGEIYCSLNRMTPEEVAGMWDAMEEDQ